MLNIEWPIVRGAVGVFCLCLVVSAALLGAGFLFRGKMLTEYKEHQSQFRAISQTYLAVEDEEKIIKELYPRFIALYEKGVIGDEQRLSWIEVLTQVGQKLKLPELSYEIASREPYEPSYPLARGNYALFNTKMNLRLGMLHEGDLANVLQALESHASGMFNISQCDLARKGTEIMLDPEVANIEATCQLDWHTIDLVGTKIEL